MSDDKLDKAVFSIFRMTHEGKLEWEHKPAPELWSKTSDDSYPIYFETWSQGRKLALFERSSTLSELSKMANKAFGGLASDRTTSIHLALLGKNDECLFEFPRSRQIDDMFKAVRYKEANVDEFIDALLKSEPASEK